MRIHARTTALAAAAVTAALVLGACGASAGAGGDGSGGKDNFTVGVLLPAGGFGRFGNFDQPLLEQGIKQQCPDCRIKIALAKDDPATQQQQFDAMITGGVRVVILTAVDAHSVRSSVIQAHRAGIPVVAYDRLADGPISGYVSYDGIQVGRLQGEALLKAMADRGRGNHIVMMNGSTTDPNARDYKRGALSVLKGKAKIGRSYNTVDWQQSNAYDNMTSAIAALGPNGIDGVLSANDNLATGIIKALKAARISPLPPITGQDADLPGVQRLVTGEQLMTVYKSFKLESRTAVDMAVALGRGQSLDKIARTTVDNSTDKNIPAVLLSPVSVTAGTIKNTLVKDGVYTVEQICAPNLWAACAKVGLTR
ncbi:sugar ABC transporter substrate-binding protein [Streptomyces sp. NPDC020917]|uniref:sugar ABC transporter substrate-binding protein n=1 Tax=Streptomyces sp. NPDC020917 TaxID=3365102 RepID=UPI0037A5D2CC